MGYIQNLFSKEMTAVETHGELIELAWDSFGIRRIDFRPNWDGDYVNVFTTVEPQESEEATATFMMKCARSLSEWILANRMRFGDADRFLVIIGWPLAVRESGRQVIRTGGTYEELRGVADGETPLIFRKGWSVGVFNPKEGEQAGHGDAKEAV
jgi:hypothetical protein